MKHLLLIVIFSVLFPVLGALAQPPVAPNGIQLFADYHGWEVVAPSYREDKGHIRIILGNPLLLNALREGVRPFPDGAVLAKVAWTTRKHQKFAVATEPDKFVQVEFMVKDSAKYKATGGWGFARFVGSELRPYGKDASFVQECFSCHIPVKNNDYVFSGLAPTP
jgi:hypothetical protein